MKKVLLVGNPNVGKSALFSRLTGVDVITANYSGTTVEYKKGRMKLEGKEAEIIDVPGVYSLDASSKAEEVAIEMLKQGDMVVNVVDVTNLERNLYLTMQLLEKNIPMVIALNFWNETKHCGVKVDLNKLKKMLGVPVIPTVAITAEGVRDIVKNIKNAKKHSLKLSSKEKWAKIGKIIKAVQKIHPRKHTLLQRLEDLTIHPLTGVPIAAIVMLFLFFTIRVIGESLITYIFDPLFSMYLPLVQGLSSSLGKGFLHDLLIGHLIEGEVDFLQSMGLLTTGLFVPLAMVLPYVLAFYFILGILEDSGYLPRLSTLVDTVMHKIGLHGLAIIPMMLGAGCNVPGVLGTRILESKRQRFIVITLLSIAIPCMAQTAMLYGLLGSYGIRGLGVVFLTLFIVWIVLGIILNRYIKGEIPETFIEITPYRMPKIKILTKKLWWRMRGFMKEAIPYMLLGVIIVNVLYILNMITFVGKIAAPIVSGIFGLPRAAVGSLIIGFLRKDVAVGMLLPLGLTLKQLIIASVVLTMYFPCIATFVIIFKELGLKDTIKSTLIMLGCTLAVGGLLNLVL
ncbi:MAG: ferrous iron transporter B [Nanoarchaeota archaeon]|nr:ferrous iron transporter B [Nanoarchaeota archaeon]MBU1705095.1 ferrous iron transporter B [Nanoarchaeota archaeon]